MGKFYPTFCAKNDIFWHVSFSFFLISFVTSWQHGFLLFPQVSEHLWGPKVSLIVDFCIFYVVSFSTGKVVKLNQNHFFLCHFLLHCVEEQSRPYAVDCWRATSFPVKKSKFLLTFLCCIFWLDLMNHFLIKNSPFSFAFFTILLGNILKRYW